MCFRSSEPEGAVQKLMPTVVAVMLAVRVLAGEPRALRIIPSRKCSTGRPFRRCLRLVTLAHFGPSFGAKPPGTQTSPVTTHWLSGVAVQVALRSP